MPSIEHMFAEQEALRRQAIELRTTALQPSPPAREPLNAARWALARTLMRHLSQKDRLVYARLREHPEPAVAAIGQRYSDEAGTLYALFIEHTARWTPVAVEADWHGYATSVRQMTRLLDDRIAREEAELLPHLASAPEIAPRRSIHDRNWAADGWRIRAMLEIDEAVPGASLG